MNLNDMTEYTHLILFVELSPENRFMVVRKKMKQVPLLFGVTFFF